MTPARENEEEPMSPFRIPVLALLCLAAAHAAALQEAQPEADTPASTPAPATSGATVAERTVRVYWDPSSHPPDIGSILTNLFSEEVAGKLGEKTLGVAPEAVMQLTEYGPVKVAEDSFEFTFVVRLGPVPPGEGPSPKERGVRLAAGEFADALVKQLAHLLNDYREAQARPLLEMAEEDVAETQNELEQLRVRSARLQSDLRERSGRTDVSPEGVQAAMNRLDDERQRLELDLAGMGARLEKVQQAYEQTERKARAQAEDDPVVAELRSAVATHQRLLDITRKRFEAGMDRSQKELAEAEAAYVDAKVQLLERQAGVAAAGSGGSLAPLNNQLQSLAIDIRDRQARLEYVEKRLAALDGVSELVANYQQLEAQRQWLLRVFEEAQRELWGARRQARPPARDRVVVVNLSDRRAE